MADRLYPSLGRRRRRDLGDAKARQDVAREDRGSVRAPRGRGGGRRGRAPDVRGALRSRAHPPGECRASRPATGPEGTRREAGVVGVNEYALARIVRERLAELRRGAEAQRLIARSAPVRRARLVARLAAWLRRLRRHERQGPLTGARAARWPRRADTS